MQYILQIVQRSELRKLWTHSDINEDSENTTEELDTSILEPNVTIDESEYNIMERTYEDIDSSIFEPNISVDCIYDDSYCNIDDTTEVHSVQSMEYDWSCIV